MPAALQRPSIAENACFCAGLQSMKRSEGCKQVLAGRSIPESPPGELRSFPGSCPSVAPRAELRHELGHFWPCLAKEPGVRHHKAPPSPRRHRTALAGLQGARLTAHDPGVQPSEREAGRTPSPRRYFRTALAVECGRRLGDPPSGIPRGIGRAPTPRCGRPTASTSLHENLCQPTSTTDSRFAADPKAASARRATP